MQVSVEKTSELSRKMTVTLPEDLVKEKMDSKFKTAAKQVSLKGFRPGKVPQNVVKKMYGDQIRGEVLGELIQSSYVEAIEDQGVKPAGPPNIVPAGKFEEGQSFEYTAEFEVYPEVSLSKLGDVEITRKTAEVKDSDLDAMIEKLREQKKTWLESDQAASEGDRVTIKFSGVCEGENFTDGEVDDFPVVLGDKQMIPGFEDNLIELSKGETKSFDVTFPDPYSNEKLAGKPATFEIEVLKVEQSKLPEIDADFMKDYGVDNGDIETFRTEIKSNMQRELANAMRSDTKKSVMDALYENIEFDLPKVMVDEEIENLMKPIKESAAKQNKDVNEMELPADAFEQQARKRVALSLIMSEIIISNEIKIEPDKVRATIEDIAQSYEQPQELINYYYGDEKRLSEVQQMVLEDQAVEWVLDHVKIQEQPTEFENLMNHK